MGKKKANGEGSICKRADGRYMARYTVNGSRKAVYGDSFEEARQKLNVKLYEIANGIYIDPGKDTVGKWLRDWLTIYALPTVKQSTYVSYEAYVRLHLDPELGNVKLTALTTEQIQLFLEGESDEEAGTFGSTQISERLVGDMSSLLQIFMQFKANIQTINSIVPTNGCAVVTISAETMDMTEPLEEMLRQMRQLPGIIKAEVLAG